MSSFVKSEEGSLTNFYSPSPEELDAVAELQEHLSDYNFTDIKVLRFYRGRGKNKEKAKDALLRHMEWRNEYDVDNIVTQKNKFESEIEKKKAIIGDYFDKSNRPVIYVIAGRHQSSNRDIDQMRLYIIYIMEEVMKRTAPEEERLSICFDLSDFSFGCMDYEVVKQLIDILSYNYPEILSVAYIVNAPFIFTACWAIIKPWIDPRSVAKVQFIAKSALLNFINEEAIPIDVVPRENIASDKKRDLN